MYFSSLWEWHDSPPGPDMPTGRQILPGRAHRALRRTVPRRARARLVSDKFGMF